MSKRYEYLDGCPNLKGCRQVDPICVICGVEPVKTTWRDNRSMKNVGICARRRCQKEAKAAVYLRNGEQITYRIESGWETNPIWHCKVILDKPVEVGHLHTTQALGDAPSVFSGKTSGLLFQPTGGLWPIEAREGQLILTSWVDDVKSTQEISVAEAIAFFSPC